MADLILIFVILLLLYKIEFKTDGIFEDYLSLERTNILKAIMAFDVMLSHCVLDYLNVDSVFLKFTAGGDAVKIFFFLSGFGLAVSSRKKGETYLKGFFSHRLSKILVPIIIVTVINVAFFKYTGTFYDVDGISIQNVFNCFFNNGYTVVFNLWYVIELVILYVLFYLSFKLSNGDYIKGINYSVVFTIALMFVFYIIFLYKPWLPVWFYSTYAFAFGLVWGAKEPKITALAQKKHNYIILTLVPVGAMLTIIVLNCKTFLESGEYDILKNLILGPVVIFGVILAGMKIRVNCKFWVIMGKISYEIYLVHGIFTNFLRGNKIYIQNNFLYILSVLLSSIVCAFIVHYVSQFILKIYFKVINSVKRKEG